MPRTSAATTSPSARRRTTVKPAKPTNFSASKYRMIDGVRACELWECGKNCPHPFVKEMCGLHLCRHHVAIVDDIAANGGYAPHKLLLHERRALKLATAAARRLVAREQRTALSA